MNRAVVFSFAIAAVPVFVGLVFGIYHQVNYGSANRAEDLRNAESKRRNKIFESCITSVRYMVRDETRGSDLRLGAAFWNGNDERIVLVSGFARTRTSDIPVVAELSKCATGYTIARYAIGSESHIRDEVEHKRITEIMLNKTKP